MPVNNRETLVPWTRLWRQLDVEARAKEPLGDDGFLRRLGDSLGMELDDGLKSLDKLLGFRCLVLCGEPGMGKSSTLAWHRPQIEGVAGTPRRKPQNTSRAHAARVPWATDCPSSTSGCLSTSSGACSWRRMPAGRAELPPPMRSRAFCDGFGGSDAAPPAGRRGSETGARHSGASSPAARGAPTVPPSTLPLPVASRMVAGVPRVGAPSTASSSTDTCSWRPQATSTASAPSGTPGIRTLP